MVFEQEAAKLSRKVENADLEDPFYRPSTGSDSNAKPAN